MLHIALAFALFAPAVDDTLADVELKITERMHKIESMRAKMTMVTEMSNPGFEMKTSSEGTYELEVKDGHQSYRHEQTMASVTKVGGQEMKTDTKSTIIGKDRETLSLSEMNGQKIAMKMKTTEDQIPAGKALDSMRETYELTLVGEERANGRKCWVIEGTPKTPDGLSGKSRFSYDQETGFMVKLESFTADGKPMTTMDFTDLVVGDDIDDARFSLEVPEGYTVQEMPGAMDGG